VRAPARLLVWPVALGVAVLVGGVLGSSPVTTYGGASQELLWLQGAAVVALLVLASLPRDRARFAALTLAATTWLLPELAGWAHGGDVLRTAADAWARALPGVLLVALDPRPFDWATAHRLERTAVVAFCLAALARLLLVDPFLQLDCWRTCARNPLVVGDGRVGAWVEAALVVAGTAAAAGVAVVRVRAAVRRGSRRQVLRSGVAGALLLGSAGAAVLRLVVPEAATSPPHLALLLLVQTTAVGLALVDAGERIAQWRLSERLARLAGELTAAPPPGSLATALRTAVHDAALEVLYRSPGREALVDAEGRDVDVATTAAGRRTTPVGRRGQQVALVVHSPDVDGERIDRALGPALRLALENEQLRAAALAELAELRRSRARIVERSGLERRRLERNLHDGAQQRAVSLALLVRMLAARVGEGPGRPAAARAQALTRQTVEELRGIARGIYPAVLADSGLTGALHDLAESSTDVAVRVEAALKGRYTGPVGTTACMVAAEALADARAREAATATVCAEEGDAVLVLDIRDDGRPGSGSWTGRVADEVGALCGVLTVSRLRGGMVVRMELPCAS
jgi:signal transduction histidine kinase